MENILVAGATGTTGNIIVNLLKESNKYTPIAMVRKEEQRADFEAKGIKTILANLESDLSGIADGADRVIFAAGSGGNNVEGVDRDGAIKLVKASEKASVKKFVMLSSINADQPESSDELEEYLKAKKEADAYLRQSNLPYTIVRPGSLTNDKATGKIKWEEKLSTMGEVDRADVAKVLVGCLDDQVATRTTFEFIKGEKEIEQALREIPSSKTEPNFA
ncbi:MAG: SDR family oxidoreductase [Leeuwenhoekiella sp.]